MNFREWSKEEVKGYLEAMKELASHPGYKEYQKKSKKIENLIRDITTFLVKLESEESDEWMKNVIWEYRQEFIKSSMHTRVMREFLSKLLERGVETKGFEDGSEKL